MESRRRPCTWILCILIEATIQPYQLYKQNALWENGPNDLTSYTRYSNCRYAFYLQGMRTTTTPKWKKKKKCYLYGNVRMTFAFINLIWIYDGPVYRRVMCALHLPICIWFVLFLVVANRKVLLLFSVEEVSKRAGETNAFYFRFTQPVHCTWHIKVGAFLSQPTE